MKLSSTELFRADHKGHRIERQERQFKYEQVATVPSLRGRWRPGRVFVVLYCHDCSTFVVIDEAEQPGAPVRGA